VNRKEKKREKKKTGTALQVAGKKLSKRAF